MRTKVLLPPIFYWLLLVLPGGALRSQAQAPYHVPLGSAAAYGLLSAGTITAQDAVPGIPAVDIPIQVLGKAGASQGIGPLVTATNGKYAQGSGNVPTALADLQNARTYCSGFYSTSTGQIPAQLGGQTLTGGVYNISGNALLGSSGPLTINGDTSTVVIVNITGALSLQASSQVVLQGVVARHVYWNVSGTLTIADNVLFGGVALLGGAALVDGIQAGGGAILSQQGIALTRLSAIIGHNKFMAAAVTQNCPGFAAGQVPLATCTFTRPGSELVRDGSFELERCCPYGYGGMGGYTGYFTSYACFWQDATEGSADYYKNCTSLRGFSSTVSVPVNIQTIGQTIDALAQNSQARTGQAYAGIVCYGTTIDTVTKIPVPYQERST